MTAVIKRGRRNLYPWEEWFAAGECVLIDGEHFCCDPYYFRQMIRNAASRLNKSAHIETLDSGEGFRVVLKEKKDA